MPELPDVTIYVESLKRLDLEDITETEFTEDISESVDADLQLQETPFLENGNFQLIVELDLQVVKQNSGLSKKSCAR